MGRGFPSAGDGASTSSLLSSMALRGSAGCATCSFVKSITSGRSLSGEASGLGVGVASSGRPPTVSRDVGTTSWGVTVGGARSCWEEGGVW